MLEKYTSEAHARSTFEAHDLHACCRDHVASRQTRHLALMSIADESGKVFKAELKAGKPKMGLFLNSGSPTIAEQLSCSGYDWLLVDAQHGPMNPET